MSPTLERLFLEYADSHRHKTNQLTHKIAIPLIVFHVIAMVDWIKLAPLPGLDGYQLSVAHLLAPLAIAWYLRHSLKLGLILGFLFALCFPIAAVTPKPAVIAIAIVAWIVQLAGHAIWEKKSPAFLSNMIQTLVGPAFFVAKLTGDWPLRARTEEARA